MCGRKSQKLWLFLAALLWLSQGSSWAEDVLVPAETWDRITTLVTEQSLELGQLKTQFETLERLRIEERRSWALALNEQKLVNENLTNSLAVSTRNERVLKVLALAEAGALLAAIVFGLIF